MEPPPPPHEDYTTTQALRKIDDSRHPISLSRLSRAARRAKNEAKVVTKSWNMHTFISDVFGPRKTWFVPAFEASEWGFILYLFHTHSVTRLMRLSITTIGSVLIPPLGVVLYSRFLFSTRVLKEKVKFIGEKYAARNIEADEDWWYINGTGVNADLQRANGYQISEIFHKQVRLFYNPTTGLLFDFAACVIGLLSYKTRPSSQLAKALCNRFESSPSVKIILVVHSMGAIIATNAIKYMIRKGLTKDLWRLELYTFGSPAVEFLHVIDKQTMTRVPFYEHYANTHDYCAKIGSLRLTDAHWWAVGRVFVNDRQGHFFGDHYLPGVPQREYLWRGSPDHSRLYSYLPNVPTPVPSPPGTIAEYMVNPRRPRRHHHSKTQSTPPSLSPLTYNLLPSPDISFAPHTTPATPPVHDMPPKQDSEIEYSLLIPPNEPLPSYILAPNPMNETSPLDLPSKSHSYNKVANCQQ